MRLLAALLLALPLQAVDWTVNAPELTTISVRNDPGRVTIVARVTFRGNAGETHIKDYEVAGADALTILRRRVFDDRATLQAREGMAIGSLTPLAPTAADAALASYVTAVRKLQALTELTALMGWTDSSTIGSTAVTLTQASNALKAEITADMTNQARIALALENFPQ